MRKKKKKISKKKVILTSIAIAAIFFVIYLFTPKEDIIDYATHIVERGDIIQTVSETGVVKLPKKIDLSFSTQGQLKEIYFDIGDVVKEGDVIAVLNNDSLRIRERELLANLEITQANLAKLLAGASKEDIDISEANVSQALVAHNTSKREFKTIKASAEESVSQAQETLNDLWSSDVSDVTVYEQAIELAQLNLKNTKDASENVLNNSINSGVIQVNTKLNTIQAALDSITQILEDDDISSVFSIKDLVFKQLTQDSHDSAKALLAEARLLSNTAMKSKDQNDLEVSIKTTILALSSTNNALNNCFNALESSITSSVFSQAELNSYKAEVSAHLSAISAAALSLEASRQSIETAVLNHRAAGERAAEDLVQAKVNYNNAVIQAENRLSSAKFLKNQQIEAAQSRVDSTQEVLLVAQVNLNKINASVNEHDLVLAQSQVRQSQAALDLLRKQIKDTEIRAPFDATVSRVFYEVGEQVSPLSNAVSILGKSDFEVEVLISETDIYKLKVGNKVELTLDALGFDLKFPAYVDFVEPAETRIQDVIYYKVKIKFVESVNLIGVKHGMTANVEIMTNESNSVLYLPSRTILEGNGRGRYIRVLKGGEVIERNVKTGLRGDGGQVEVLFGVEEGDEVILYIRD